MGGLADCRFADSALEGTGFEPPVPRKTPDEVGTVEALREHRSAADPLIAQHGGRVVKTTGYGVLIEFASVVGAVECHRFSG